MVRWDSPLRLCVLVLALLVSAALLAQETAKPTQAGKRKRLAVVNFEIPPTVYMGWGDDGHGAAERLGAVLSDMMITSLLQSGSFDVIERNELEKILKEQNLKAEGLLDKLLQRTLALTQEFDPPALRDFLNFLTRMVLLRVAESTVATPEQ